MVSVLPDKEHHEGNVLQQSPSLIYLQYVSQWYEVERKLKKIIKKRVNLILALSQRIFEGG